MTHTTDIVVERVVAVVSRVAGSRTPAEVGPDTRLAEEGFWLSSLELAEVVVSVEEEFGVELDPERDLTQETLLSIGSLTRALIETWAVSGSRRRHPG